MSFLERRIRLTFLLGQGAFGNGGYNQTTLEGLRVAATVTKQGGVSMSQLQMRVFGMPLTDMNRLSTLGKPLVEGRNNKVRVEAGDDATGYATVFIGTISEAWVDLTDQTNAAFIVTAHSGLLDALKPAPPASYRGPTSVSVIMASLAQEMGYQFEDGGVQVTLANPYFPGTPRMQVEQAAAAANINWVIDDETLAIWPKGQARGGVVPLLNASTGLVGYPAHTQNGIALQVLFTPSITFGGRVQVDSDLTPANGTWTVFSVTHDLESETPGGKWFTRLECSVLGFQPLAR